MPQPMSFFRLWQCILQFTLILWIVRVVVAMTVLGLLILGLAPQAQDLFVEFADVPVWRMVLFGCVMVVVWAMPTHYAARLLLDTDERFRQLLEAQRGVRSGTFPRSRGKVASPGPAGRQDHVTCSPRWTASPLHPSLSFRYTQCRVRGDKAAVGKTMPVLGNSFPFPVSRNVLGAAGYWPILTLSGPICTGTNDLRL